MAIKPPRPTQGKQVKVSSSTVSQEIQHPVFCFRYLVKEHSLDGCEDVEIVALVKQMHALSQLTWDEIRITHRHGMGSEKIDRNSIRARIPAFITDDVNFFLALRFHGKKPFVGLRKGSVFHVLWIDNKFCVYNHG